MTNKIENKVPNKEDLNTLKIEAAQDAQGIGVPFGERPKNVAPIQNAPISEPTKSPCKQS